MAKEVRIPRKLKPNEPISVNRPDEHVETMSGTEPTPLSPLEAARRMVASGHRPSALDQFVAQQHALNVKLAQAWAAVPAANPKPANEAQTTAEQFALLADTERENALRALFARDAVLFGEVAALLPALTAAAATAQPKATTPVPQVSLDFESMPELRAVLLCLLHDEQLTVKQVRAATNTGALARTYLDQLIAVDLVRQKYYHGRGVYELTDAGAAYAAQQYIEETPENAS